MSIKNGMTAVLTATAACKQPYRRTAARDLAKANARQLGDGQS